VTTTKVQVVEAAKCVQSAFYFIYNYVKIDDPHPDVLEWIPFRLWSPQKTVLEDVQDHRLVVVLKARQVGLTWLVLAFILWLMLFRPGTKALMFSHRDPEAIHLLDDRLKGMFNRLPRWLRHGIEAISGGDSKHVWQLNNGSECRAYTPKAGDTYTATIVFVDEADLVPNLNELMRSAKPTIDAGGWMILVSRVDKTKPSSEFKALYKAAKAGVNEWRSVFLPWDARPDRDDTWYARQRADILARTGSLDDLHEQYPTTDAEALAPRAADKRVPADWLLSCWREGVPVSAFGLPPDAPAVPGLRVYSLPKSGVRYVAGGDPAEGLPSSTDSALVVLREDTGVQVAALNEKLEPKFTFPGAVAAVCRWYNRAAVLLERNNHGHATIGWLEEHAPDMTLLAGLDGRPGWVNSPAGKVRMWDNMAATFMHNEIMLYDFQTHAQVASIDKSTLKAPEGQLDDLAVACALADLARAGQGRTVQRLTTPGVSPIISASLPRHESVLDHSQVIKAKRQYKGPKVFG